MNNIADKVKKESCTGCCACSQICPAHAITMRKDRNGFLYPVVDSGKCTECGLCILSCAVHTPMYNNIKAPECMAVMAGDRVRQGSASGGAFTVLAEYILSRGGCVCGAAFMPDFSVKHCIVEDAAGLETIRGTKYMQSDLSECLADVKRYLKAGRQVLFSGLPCQVAGLYRYLGREYANLYTVDLICHGVPSQKVFETYMRDKFPGKKIRKLSFRDKENFSWSSNMSIEFSDGMVYRNDHRHDSFYKAFLSGMAVRESCAECRFSKMPRQGDVTIGDFWGIAEYAPELDDKKGTSIVLINSIQGSSLFTAVKERFGKAKSMKLEQAVKGNPPIVAPFKMHPARKRFFNGLGVKSFDRLVEDAGHFQFDVAIVDLWYGINYGSILTAYALYEVVKGFGLEPVMLYKPESLWEPRFEDKNSIAGAFIYERCNVSNPRKDKYDWRMLNDNINTFLVGSDVVWNYQICGRQSEYYFFLDFVNDSRKKIAYASSFGGGYHAPDEIGKHVGYYLKRFDYISVREKEGVKICREKFGVEAALVLDPVFLCKKDIYEEAAKESGIRHDGPFLFAYILGPDKTRNRILHRAEDLMQMQAILTVNPNNFDSCRELAERQVTDVISVQDWLYYISHCDYFIGDSFHGMCFAIIFRKPFMIIFDRKNRSVCRFKTLLSQLGLEERLIYLDEAEKKADQILRKKIDYEEVYIRLDRLKAESENWLKNSIFNAKEETFSDREILRAEMDERFRLLQERLDRLERKSRS